MHRVKRYSIKKTNIWAWDDKHTHLYFKKNYPIDGSTWSKNSSTWNMLKNRFDNTDRDSQRSKLYLAEDIMDEFDCGTAEAMSWNELIEKIAEIINNTWFRRKFGNLFCETDLQIHTGHKRQNMAYAFGTDELSFPPNFRNLPLILHELTHIIMERLTWVVAFRKPYNVHGRMFSFIYLELVKKFIGKKEHDLLKKSYKEHGVKFQNRRLLTSSQKKVLRERFIKSVKKENI
jgi:hypothetical protein